jgi:hypothetical protein
MMMKLFFKTHLILVLSICLFAGREFQLVEKWQHDEYIGGILYDAIVDQDGDLITAFQRAGVMIANAKKIAILAPFGQGPDDVDAFFTLCSYKGDLAIEGMAGKLKIFQKKNGKYSWKQTIWKNPGKAGFYVSDGQFLAGKWFFATPSSIRIPNDKNNCEANYIRIYDENGKYIKSLLRKEYRIADNFYSHLLGYYLEPYKENILFIGENELLVRIISPKSMKFERTARLTAPSFYKPMPAGNYRDKKVNRYESTQKTLQKWADWKTNYSRICRIAIDGDLLVLQIRTCAKDLKRFALLFYNAETFKLEDTVFTNDLLLAVKDGKYYLFANGEPTYDDEASEYIINIYRFKDKK